MDSRDQTVVVDSGMTLNYPGAAIFWSYIVAALALTTTILYGLYSQHRSQAPLSPQRQRQLLTFSSLAFLSFTALSANMINVLVQSFALWARHRPAVGTISAYPAEIYKWSTTSTLFLDFGEAIVANSARFLWTQSALLVTMSVNFYMALEGRRRNVPKLWVYFALGQILPISFALGLYYCALTLATGESKKEVRFKRIWAVATIALYCSCLANAQLVASTVWLMPLILAARALLLVPFHLATEIEENKVKHNEEQLLSSGVQRIVLLTSTVMTLIKSMQILQEGWTLQGLGRELFSHPAL
ncbi:hypothetical protein B0A48_07091 [Cryoendolithus antarcticus]|uniref:Uncharacterized protein n=1 Tax=Cryoendolithus antarcticus TaxID=1507870 RepID=A0A1V8T7Y4_9PEZI|nr:hypothetical protein B0A48_07091 [Cryoendolithus antarcticus]